MNEIRVIVQLKNNIMLKEMERNGFFTNASLSDATGVSQSDIGNMINLRASSVFTKEGIYRKACTAISYYLGVSEEILFPPKIYKYNTNKTISEIGIEEIERYKLQSDPEEMVLNKILHEKLEIAMDTILPREKEVIKLRIYEDKTLDEVGKILGVTKERVRQIEAKGLSRLRKQLVDFYN